MITPDDILRLSLRVECLEHTSTSGWHPADELDFKNALSTGRAQRKLPSSITLRGMAATMRASKEAPERLTKDFPGWIRLAMDLESLAHRNDPRNPHRMIRDMMAGRFPGYRG